ncbi:MAG: hypothetical protein ACT4PU_11580 [Planctomycetota bacterium]
MRFGNRCVDSRTRDVAVGPEQAFAPIRRIGGLAYWYGLYLLHGLVFSGMLKAIARAATDQPAS